jgi:hypothetical protein
MGRSFLLLGDDDDEVGESAEKAETLPISDAVRQRHAINDGFIMVPAVYVFLILLECE